MIYAFTVLIDESPNHSHLYKAEACNMEKRPGCLPGCKHLGGALQSTACCPEPAFREESG